MLDKIAADVHEEYTQGQDLAQIDPATILIIMELVQQIMAMFANCKKTPQEAANISRSPSALQKIVLRSRIRKEYGRFDQKLFNALIATGTRLEEVDVAAAYDELGF